MFDTKFYVNTATIISEYAIREGALRTLGDIDGTVRGKHL